MVSSSAQIEGPDPGSISALEAIALLSACVLAGVFVWAATAKLRDRATTANDFAALGLPAAPALSIWVPVFELGVAVALVLFPGWGAVAAFGLLALFSATLFGAIRAGSTASCACFGATSRAPVSVRQLYRNAGLAVLALAALPFTGSTIALL